MNKLQQYLLLSGVAAALLFAAMILVFPFFYPGYNSFSQTVSEFSAIGTPTRQWWLFFGFFYAVLFLAFGVGVFRAGLKNRTLRIIGLILIFNGVFGFFWPPMHQREVLAAGGGTLTDTLHLVWAGVTVLGMFLYIGFGAFAFGKQFRAYSFVTILFILFFGFLTSLDAPKVGQNLPTPYSGVWERVNIFANLLWISVLSIVLLKKHKVR